MGVTKYEADGRTWWKVDEWLEKPTGELFRFRKKRIPTREQAMALAAKAKAEAFEGRFFDRRHLSAFTVADAWREYAPKAERDNDTWLTDKGRAVHVLRHLGGRRAANLTLADVEEYRTKRLSETTRRGSAPASATLDREVELLKRVLNYAARCGNLPSNPLASVPLLNKPNVRRVVLDEEKFKPLLDAAEPELKPILVVAFDTGMRLGEVLKLRWHQVNLKDGVIELAPQDTKSEDARTVVLTQRARAVLDALPRGLHTMPVFANPETGAPWRDIRKVLRRAKNECGLEELWFHDLRRSFVTKARKLGIAESVVMKMSGHKTRAVFDRYNVVTTEDVRAAAQTLDSAWTRLGHSDEEGGQKHRSPSS